jgi:hypothetical protein
VARRCGRSEEVGAAQSVRQTYLVDNHGDGLRRRRWEWIDKKGEEMRRGRETC